LNTPQGRRVVLRGKIDRIDVAEHDGRRLAFVFDYKRSRQRTLNLAQVYHGLSLQLIVYLLGLEAAGRKLTGQPITPAGAFYLPLIPDFEKVDRPDQDTDYALKSYRPRGVFEFAALRALDRDLTVGSSSVIAAILSNEGHLTRRTGNDAAEADDFRRLVEHVRYTVGRLCDDILDGLIPVSPYRLGLKMPCQTCDFRSVCRFEFPEGGARRLESMSRNEVFERLADA
jgi:ATP-dependent helicase/nuclease subunit B